MREITSGVSPPRASGSPRKAKPRQSGQVCMRNLGWSSPSTAGRYGEHRACQNFSSKARERNLNARILGVEYSDRGSNLMAKSIPLGRSVATSPNKRLVTIFLQLGVMRSP
jgi:hypothetical protein